MNIDIKTKNITLNQPLTVFCRKVASELEKFLNVLEDTGSGMGATAKGWIEIGKTTLHHRKGPYFRAECQIFLPGRNIRAEAESEDLRQAVNQVRDEVQRQLKAYKEKSIARRKRGQRQIKKTLNLTTQAQVDRPRGARVREEGI